METQQLFFTEEMKAKLQGFLPMKPNSSFAYVPEIYRQKDENGNYLIPKELWAIFVLKQTDGIDSAKSEDEMFASFEQGEAKGLHIASGTQRVKALSKGIINIKNWYDSDGKLIEFKRDSRNPRLVSEETLRQIPPKLQVELQDQLERGSTLSEEELLGLKF